MAEIRINKIMRQFNIGLDDLVEFTIGTNPLQPDTDGDGMNDGWEHRYGFDPTVDNATDTNPNNDIDADPDEDGLTNGQECECETKTAMLNSVSPPVFWYWDESSGTPVWTSKTKGPTSWTSE